MTDKAGLLAIGLGIGVFSTIARTLWLNNNVVIQVMLISIVIVASFIGIKLLRKNNQSNSKENNTTH